MTPRWISSLILAAIGLLSMPAVAQNRCASLFTESTDWEISTPEAEISLLQGDYVFKVETAGATEVYKIYSNENHHRTRIEARGLRMLGDIFKKSGAALYVPEVIRVAENSEHGLFEMYRAYGELVRWNPVTALVTSFVPGREVSKLFDDPAVSAAQKSRVLLTFRREIKKAIRWLKAHPEYRFEGERVEAEIMGVRELGDYMAYDSSRVPFVFGYENYIFRLKQGERDSSVDVWLDGFSNTILGADGRLTVFDPY